MNFTFTPCRIPEVLLVEHERVGDNRGFFAETFREAPFREHGLGPFVQENLSRSASGVLRGLHFQKAPAAIAKLVRCTRGRIFDVAVDLRRSSPTFREVVAVELCESDNHMLFVPVGFAHGFSVLSDVAEISYKTTGYYSAEHDCGIRWNDPELNVPWPVSEPSLSSRDRQLPLLREAMATIF